MTADRLSIEEIAAVLDRDGYVHLPQLLSPAEVQALRPANL